jgi:hypothetical protein
MRAVGGRSAVWALVTRNRIVDERDENGSLEIFLPKNDVLVTRTKGHFSANMARAWITTIDPYFRRGTVFATFHDWDEMTAYDSAARRLLTGWLLANKSGVRTAEFLVSSRLVAMGLSAANLATTIAGLGMVAHTARSSFEQSLTRAL